MPYAYATNARRSGGLLATLHDLVCYLGGGIREIFYFRCIGRDEGPNRRSTHFCYGDLHCDAIAMIPHGPMPVVFTTRPSQPSDELH